MQRFFVETGSDIEEENHSIHVTGADVNHIRNVLRMKQGEELWISDGGAKRNIAVQIRESWRDEEVLLHIILLRTELMSCLTGSIFFRDLPKARQDGADRVRKQWSLELMPIVPVETKRCVVKLDAEERLPKRQPRWQQIAESAAKQSKRMHDSERFMR